MAAVAEGLDALSGARHVSVTDTGRGGAVLVTADVRADVADAALAMLEQRDVPADDIVLVRLDAIGPVSGELESLALVWADLVGRARVQARAPARYFVFMAAAGVIAAFGVINLSAVLIVGAMAVSPDLLPITAACTGLVLRRRRLLEQGLVTLLTGLGVTCLLALVVTGFLKVFGLLPDGFTLQAIPTGQTHVGASTILVALAAGVAGMLAVETRASSAVGVAISVTTVPAAAFLGVAISIGDVDQSLSALAVLGLAAVLFAANSLGRRALVADPTAQVAIVSWVEPDRDQDRTTRRRRLHQLRVVECRGAATVRDRGECLGVRCSLGSGMGLFPAANLGVELLAVIAPDPVVQRPAVLRGSRKVVRFDHFSHRRHRTQPDESELIAQAPSCR